MSQPNDREEAIFTGALQLPPGERTAYLDKTCGDDGELRERVQALLKAHDQAGGPLEQPAASPAKGTILLNFSVTEKAGDRIGRYKLLQQIGEGGCGVVYMAEQEEPVRRRVALKVIKLGMDTKSVIARFEAERQALALMDHPNIAKVLDAGGTDTGRPFFVMELVRGIKITEYCDQNNLTTLERLDLFIQVCRAIQHAHQKGIIHRDIKPSNILVTLHDGVPVPKVIDFGIAKATTDQQLTDKTVFTQFEQFIGTPAYMSPEQAEMSGLDIDTRTDIYALGVLLYELLAGMTPFDPKELMASGLDQMRRTIREKEPARPSTRLKTMLEGDLTATAKRRQTEPPKLIHLIRGDLDWIVMKALEKDRTRRYETANGFAMDIQRYLDNEPVLARPPGQLYRFQKLVRRNKLAFAAAGAVAVALILGLGFSTWSFIKEKQARSRADTAAAKSQVIAGFLEDMLKGVGPAVAQGQDTALLQEILDRTAAGIGNDLKDQPDVEAELRNTIGEVYQALALPKKAEDMHRSALALQRRAGGESVAMTVSMNDLALALREQGVAARDPVELAKAEEMHREALKMQRRLLGDKDPVIATSLNNLGIVLRWQGKFEEAEKCHLEALARQRELQKKSPGDKLLPLAVATSLNNLALVLYKQGGRLSEAEQYFRQALAIQREFSPGDDPANADSAIAFTLDNLALVLRDMPGKLEEAETCSEKALEMKRTLFGKANPNSPYIARSLNSLAQVLDRLGKNAEAEDRYREALTIMRRQPEPDYSSVAGLLHNLKEVLMREGKFKEVEQLLNEMLTPDFAARPQSAAFLRERADFLARRGRWKEAVADFTRLTALEPENRNVYHLLLPLLVQSGELENYSNNRAHVLALFSGAGDAPAAAQVAGDCLLLPVSGVDLETAGRLAETAAAGGTNRNYQSFQFVRGLADYRRGQFELAADRLRRVLEAPEPLPELRVETGMVLAMARQQLKQSDEARSNLTAGVTLAESKLPKLDSGELGPGWHDVLVAHILMREARGLIEGAEPSKPGNP